jgi:murein L,D-transpeptidase YafK
MILLCLFSLKASSQQTNEPKPTNIKILSEEPYGKDYIKRVIRYDRGMQRVTETIYFLKNSEPVYVKFKIPETGVEKDSVKLIVDKTKRRLYVKYGSKIVRAYKATFGPTPLINKRMEGDRNTPEGAFKIASINPKSQYHRFLLLDYPNDSSFVRFEKLKLKKAIPATAKIGGDIGIHGIWQGGDDLIEMGVGWTDGCVAIKNKDIEELCLFVSKGTPVEIHK